MTSHKVSEQRVRASQDERINEWVEQQLAKPEAQGPLPRRAEQVLAGLAANRPKKEPA